MANAYNELYAFYTGKRQRIENKILSQYIGGGGRPHRHPLTPPLTTVYTQLYAYHLKEHKIQSNEMHYTFDNKLFTHIYF